MRKLKKFFSTLFVLVLMAMVLVPAASARLVVTPGISGTERRTTAAWSGGNWTQVQAETRAYSPSSTSPTGYAIAIGRTAFQPFIATTRFVETRNAFRISHLGRTP